LTIRKKSQSKKRNERYVGFKLWKKRQVLYFCYIRKKYLNIFSKEQEEVVGFLSTLSREALIGCVSFDVYGKMKLQQ